MASETRHTRDWIVNKPPPEICLALAKDLGISPLTARILVNRGISDAVLGDGFLNPTLKSMHDPFLMKDMRRAVREVLRAIDAGQMITVHGDYDVDGTCSVSVLYGFLKALGARVDYYIPVRTQDGYGLNIETVRRLHAKGTDLIITVDCGISNADEIRLAKQLGMKTIVVDHHTVPEVLPPAVAVLNPLRSDCDFPFKGLAAVGVTFNFVVALRSELRKRGIFKIIPEPDLREYLDLVALGTVADVVPLVDENRVFVRLGLEVLSSRRRAGVSALMDRAQVEVGPVSTRTISFRLAPRINAAGRMSDASICVELLTTTSYGRATELAEELEKLNRARQGEEKEILHSALAQAEEQIDLNRRALVVAGVDWNRGVLGIVASRLMEKYHRPAFLMGIEDGFAKGSARSIDGINIVEALNSVGDLLATWGGHSAAAGLSLDAVNLEAFRDRIDESIVNVFDDGTIPRPRLKIDSEVELHEIDRQFIVDLNKLAPFGAGNPEPTLLSRRSKALNVRVISNKHLRARFKDDSGMIEGFGFAMRDAIGMLDDTVAIAFVPRLVSNRGESKFEVQLKGVRPSELVFENEL